MTKKMITLDKRDVQKIVSWILDNAFDSNYDETGFFVNYFCVFCDELHVDETKIVHSSNCVYLDAINLNDKINILVILLIINMVLQNCKYESSAAMVEDN